MPDAMTGRFQISDNLSWAQDLLAARESVRGSHRSLIELLPEISLGEPFQFRFNHHKLHSAAIQANGEGRKYQHSGLAQATHPWKVDIDLCRQFASICGLAERTRLARHIAPNKRADIRRPLGCRGIIRRHYSDFSKNRHGRFQESKLFEELFERIVRQCLDAGLVQGKQLSVDGSFAEANAAKESRIPREQLKEAAQVHQTVRQNLEEVEQQNPVDEPVHEQEQISTTDPDSTYATKGGTPARLRYYDHYLLDNHSCVIVGVQASAARMSQETVAAQHMLTRFIQWQGGEPASVAADASYGNDEFLQWLLDRGITPCAPATAR